LSLNELIISESAGQTKNAGCQFIKAVFKDYNLDDALQFVTQLKQEAEDDFLLKPYASEIVK
jgi:hypothetical protein